MIKAILFDLDGVIIKDPIFSTVYAAEFGLTPEDMFPFFTKEFQKCLTGDADLKEALKPYLSVWKWDKSVDELLTYWFTHHQDIDQAVLALVEKLRANGTKCYLATNQEKYRTDYIWNKLGLNKLFDGIFVSNELHAKKPQKQFFTKITDNLHVDHPEEIILIEDTMSVIKEAQDFGLNTIYYTTLHDLQNKLSKHVSV